MSDGNPMYGVRECRGHFHVTCGGEDLMWVTDPSCLAQYATREAAEQQAALLNRRQTDA